MTMLNGEPVDSGVPHKTPATGAADGVRPIANPVAQIMGIMGLIFAFAFPPAGLILSIVAKRMSKSAGDRSPFATWGIVLGIVFTVLSVIVTIVIIAISVAGIGAAFDFCENGRGDDTFFGVPITCG